MLFLKSINCTSVFFRSRFYLLYTAYTLLVFLSFFALILGSKGSLCTPLTSAYASCDLDESVYVLVHLLSLPPWFELSLNCIRTTLLPPLPTPCVETSVENMDRLSCLRSPYQYDCLRRLRTINQFVSNGTSASNLTNAVLRHIQQSFSSASACNKGTTCTRSV